MRRYLAAYALWLLGVLSAAALALYYYRRVLAMGDEALERELRIAHPPSAGRPEGPRASAPPSPSPEPEDDIEVPGFEDVVPVDIDEARPPNFETIRRRGGAAR